MARKKGRGPNRRGTIYQDKRGIWWAQLPADDFGKRPKRRAKSEKEAGIKLAELEAERAKGIDPGAPDETLEQFLTSYLDLRVKPKVKLSTYETQQYHAEHYIIPAIGSIRLRRLKPDHIQKCLNDLLERGLARGTVRQFRKLLIAAFNSAIKTGRQITTNPALATEIAKADDDDEGELQRFTADEANRLLTALLGHRLYLLYLLALRYGLRQAELIGLRWTDIDLNKRTIYIRTQVHRKKREIRRTAPKGKSRRTVIIDGSIAALIAQHAKNQQDERNHVINSGGDWHEHGLVFPSERGTPLFAHALRAHYLKALGRAKLPALTFHALRHTAACLMLENGVPLADVSEILGHSSPAITARYYLHGSEEGKRAAAVTMAQVVGGAL